MDENKDSQELLARARDGEPSAIDEMLARYRTRLKRMVVYRMDSRIATRFDPSDVVQDTLVLAAKNFDQFREKQNVPFYPWLRKIAVNRLIDIHRQHLQFEKRSMMRESYAIGELSESGRVQLARKLVSGYSSPSERLASRERSEKIRSAMQRLKKMDREVLAMRFLEGLTTDEAAHILDITANTFAQRLVRALKRFRELLLDDGEELL